MMYTLKLIGAIGGAAGGVAVILRMMWSLSVIAAYLKRLIELTPTIEVTAQLAPLVQALVSEFRPNGGSTLKDTVTQIAKQLDAVGKEASDAKRLALDLVQATKDQNRVLDEIKNSQIDSPAPRPRGKPGERSH